MKKEFIYLMCALILFSVGFLIGKTQNDNGRYFFKNESNGNIIFDTSTGIIYYGERNTKKFYIIDIKNGKNKEYKKVK